MFKFLAFIVFSLSMFCVAVPNVCYASDVGLSEVQKQQAPERNNEVLNKVRASIQNILKKCQSATHFILYTVGLLGIMLIAMRMAFSDQNMQAFIAEVFKYTIVLGILYTAIANTDTITTWIQSFSMLALTDSVLASDPEDFQAKMFDVVLNILDRVAMRYESLSGFSNFGDKISTLFIGVFCIFLTAVIVLNYLITLIKMYLVINFGMLALATSGCSLTNRSATNYMRECISYAVQLFMLIAIAELAREIFTNFFLDDKHGFDNIIDYLLGVLIMLIFAVLSYSAPAAIGKLFDSENNAGHITPMASVAGAYRSGKWLADNTGLTAGGRAIKNFAKQKTRDLALGGLNKALTGTKNGMSNSYNYLTGKSGKTPSDAKPGINDAKSNFTSKSKPSDESLFGGKK